MGRREGDVEGWGVQVPCSRVSAQGVRVAQCRAPLQNESEALRFQVGEDGGGPQARVGCHGKGKVTCPMVLQGS